MEQDKTTPMNETLTSPVSERIGQVASVAYSEDTVEQYHDTIRQIPLLTKEDEVRLATQLVAGREAQAQKDEWESQVATGSEEPIDPAELSRVEEDIARGEEARKVFIESNTRLVTSIAKRYHHSNLGPEDLIQEGNLGLMRAVEKFDHTKGFKFSTYATWWIRQSISRAIGDTGRSIHVPRHVQDIGNAVRRARTELYSELHREPTPQELADKNEISDEKLRDILFVTQNTGSIDRKVGEDGSATVMDLIADEATDTRDATYEMAFVHRDHVERILEGADLDEREVRIIELRYGLGRNDGHTLDEVGKIFNLTRERIRQIEDKAMKKMRQSANRLDRLDEL